jgi:hypothetical protein
MDVFCDYFCAPNRATALALTASGVSLFEATASVRDPETVHLKGIDPVVMLGKLVGLLSGVSYEEMVLSGIPTEHIPAPALLTPEDAETILVEIDVIVRDTLADATEGALAEAAPSWANTEELAQDTWNDAGEVRPAMDELVGLARRARSTGQMIYCAVCP